MQLDDIEGDIAASIKEVATGEPAPKVEAVAPPVVETPEVETPPVAEVKETRERAADGKFKGKTEQAAELVDAAAPVDAKPTKDKPTEGEEKALNPPTHWPAQAKADFLNAPRSVQQAALDRESETETARKEWGGKAEEYNQIDKVIGAHRERWARDGKTPAVAINQLLAAEGVLQKDTVGGFEYLLTAYARGNELRTMDQIARKNGYMLVKATDQGQPAPGAQPAPTNAADPTVRRLESTVQELTQREQARVAEQAKARSDEEARQTATQLAEVEAVRNDPKNVYFHNLRNDIAALVRQGELNGDTRPIRERVQEAYDKACWADPTVRGLTIAAQQKVDQAAAAEAAKAKAAAARSASGSLTGSPGPGTHSGRSGASKSTSIEDDVRAAMASSRA